MADAVAILSWLTPVATDLLKKGYSYLGFDVDVDEKLHDLQNIIVPQIEMVIEAMKNSPHEDKLRGWLKSLEEAVDEAEDKLDLQDYYLLEKEVKNRAGGITVCLQSLTPIKYLSKKFNIKLKRSLAKLEKTAVRAKEFLPFLPAGSSNVRTTNESRERDTTSRLPHGVVVFGRDEERDKIVAFLHDTTAGGLESESCFSVVAIVGVGGAGKTTLAKHVFKHEREADPKYFDVFMWVPVSQIFDVENLTKQMVESASGGVKCPDLTNLDSLQGILEDSIRLRKFLLVLDDVWIEKENAMMKLRNLLAPLSAGERGSKILMTTREMGVATALRARNIVPLKELKKDNFFAMFRYYALGDTKNDDDKLYEKLEDIMRQNAPKLHGSPLAARLVGSQLSQRRDVDFWKRTLSRGDLLKDTMKSLLWSYQNLDAPLQRCFSYCSLFRKGRNIERDKLIPMWMGEGFIKHSETIEVVGQKYFDDLLSSSFFQPTERDGCYTMHDLLHDLAETVSKDRCVRVEGNLTKTIPQEIRHLSLNIDIVTSDLVEKICNLKNLRTLIIFMRTDNGIDDNLLHSIFVKLKKLRVVHLKISGIIKLPESIGDLKHLRYLYLYYSEAILPKSIYTLYHLEFLHTSGFRLLSKELANWINLQHLDFFVMTLNVAEINCWEQLGNQRKFHGSIVEIDGLENLKEKREVNMGKMDFGILHLKWSTTDNNSRSLDMDVQVLEGFRLPPQLHILTIEGYRGCVLPSWMMVGDPYRFPNLESLKLFRCRQLKQLPILPPTLRELQLYDCSFLPIVSKKDLAIIKFDVRISQVVTFMESSVGYCDALALEIEWNKPHGYDSQKLRKWLEKNIDIVYQNPQKKEEAQLVLPSSLGNLRIKSCPLTDSTLREGLLGLTSLNFLEINNIVSLTSLPSADVLECLTMLKVLTIRSCWFLTSLGGLQALGSLRELVISFCPNLSAEGGNTSVLPSSLRQLEIEACHWQHLDDSQPDLTSSIDSKSSDNIPFVASLKLGHLKLLAELSISNCPNIGSLVGLQELNGLTSLTLIGCPKLIHAETKLGSFQIKFKIDDPLLLYMLLAENVIASLPKLQIKNFRKISFTSKEEQVFQHLTSLTSLVFNNCNIKFLPNNLKTLSSLKKLRIIECPNIKSLPDLPSTLVNINLISCNPVLKRRCQKPHGEDWPKIAHIPAAPPVQIKFKIDDPLLLYMLPENVIASLPKLQIKNFRKISFTSEEEQVFQHLTSLTSLDFNNCSINFLPNNLKTLSSLKKLRIIKCPNIKSLPDLPSTLVNIRLISCNPVLKSRCQKPHGEDWPKIAHIPEVYLD